MPKGPKGEKRPADVVGAAVKVMQIATGEIEEDIEDDGKNKAAQALGRLGGQARLLQEKKFKLTHYRLWRGFPFTPARALIPPWTPTLRTSSGRPLPTPRLPVRITWARLSLPSRLSSGSAQT